MHNDIDYDKLLEKYINYVRQEEGTDFIKNRNGKCAADCGITEWEWLLLKQISDKRDE